MRMKAFWRYAAISLFVLQMSVGLRAEQPMFELGVVAPSRAPDFVTNAYSVIARLTNGRLVIVYSVVGSQKPSKMKIVSSVSDDGGKTWSAPKIVFDHPGALDADPSLLVDRDRVLVFSTTVPEPTKIDRSLIYMRESKDGVNWGEEVLLKTPRRYIAGKIHQGHRLSDGTLIMSYAWDTWADQGMPPATEGEMNLKAGVLRSTDGGKTWVPGADLYADVPKTSPHSTAGLDEAAIVVLADGRVMTLMRAPGTKLYQSWSNDGGLTWETPRPSTLTAHNSPPALWKLDNSSDVVVVWNNSPTGRTPLCVALSSNGGKSWSEPKVIVDTKGPQVSYPSVAQAKDGTIIAVWQQQLPEGGREIRMARFNRAWLQGK
ncbi:MAG TPA: sialidase family protein [Terriglobales bacterium]|nr:sialidase family protein [Terriglobales bacterium]